MIIGGFAARVRILLKKDYQDTIFWKIMPAYCVAALAHFYHHPFVYFIVPKNLSKGGLRDRHHCLCAAENTRERKALW
jgi:hypothetical protein